MQDSDHTWLEGHDDPGYSCNRAAYQVQRALQTSYARTDEPQ